LLVADYLRVLKILDFAANLLNLVAKSGDLVAKLADLALKNFSKIGKKSPFLIYFWVFLKIPL